MAKTKHAGIRRAPVRGRLPASRVSPQKDARNEAKEVIPTTRVTQDALAIPANHTVRTEYPGKKPESRLGRCRWSSGIIRSPKAEAARGIRASIKIVRYPAIREEYRRFRVKNAEKLPAVTARSTVLRAPARIVSSIEAFPVPMEAARMSIKRYASSKANETE